MYFTAIRSDEVIVVDEKTEGHFAQVYTASQQGDEWTEAQLLDNINIHREGFHIGNISISKMVKYYTLLVPNWMAILLEKAKSIKAAWVKTDGALLTN